MKVSAFRLDEAGDPSVLRLVEIRLPPPGPGEVQVRQRMVGVNFIDVYYRSGAYPSSFPAGLGVEAAGVVEVVGEGVEGFRLGDRVAYATGPNGAYAEARNIAADHLIALPDDISDLQAAGGLLKGMTVEYLLRRAYEVRPGQTVLFHAAAGGVGLIAGQWLKALGARAIGTAGGAEKCAVAARRGYDVVLDYLSEDFVAHVRGLTDGEGVPVVYDGIGRATFAGSLACLRPRGTLVAFGAASGPVPAVQLSDLARGSYFLTRPTLAAYIAAKAERDACVAALFDAIRSGAVEVPIHDVLPLAEAPRAHAGLEGRRTVGATVLAV
jgi:NADPH2:quinone reductase